jgi:hypothetical protein
MRQLQRGSGCSGHAAHRHASRSLGQCVTLNINLLLVDCLQDKDGDWVETGLHIFFGAYPNMMNVFRCTFALENHVPSAATMLDHVTYPDCVADIPICTT